MAVSAEQPSKALPPTVVNLGKSTVFSAVQPSKAELSTSAASGKATLVSPFKSSNALDVILLALATLTVCSAPLK